jgi:hypothetical protein
LIFRFCKLATWSFINATKGEITNKFPSFIIAGIWNRLIFHLQLALKQNCLDHLKRNQWFHFAAIEKSRVSSIF